MAGEQDDASRQASRDLTQLSEDLGLYDGEPPPFNGRGPAAEAVTHQLIENIVSELPGSHPFEPYNDDSDVCLCGRLESNGIHQPLALPVEVEPTPARIEGQDYVVEPKETESVTTGYHYEQDAAYQAMTRRKQNRTPDQENTTMRSFQPPRETTSATGANGQGTVHRANQYWADEARQNERLDALEKRERIRNYSLLIANAITLARLVVKYWRKRASRG